MPKREKEKKSTVNTADAPSLVGDERALEVFVVGCTESDITNDTVVLLRINNEQHTINLRDAVKEAMMAGAPALEGDAATPIPPLLLLSRQLVQVTDTAVRDTLLNRREANRVDVLSLAGAAAGGDANPGRRPSCGGEKKAKTAAPTTGGKGKGPVAASAGGHAVVPEGARPIGGAALSLIPLLTSTSLDVTVSLTGQGGTAATELHFRVCCRDAPLLTPEALLQCRPVVLRVGGLEGLPSVRVGSGGGGRAVLKDGPTMTADVAAAAPAPLSSSRLLRARVRLGEACVHTPALSVAAPTSSTSSTPAPHRQLSLTAHALSTTATAGLDQLDTPVDYYEQVLFLSTMGDPLTVYRQLHSTPCKVSLWQSFNTGVSEETSASPLKGQSAKKAKSETLLGSGSFSVRDFLSDDQVRFSEAVQLLPDRSTISLAGGQTCLTAASTIKVTLNFFTPFPPLRHVDDTGTLLNRNAFLTHAVIRLPYQASWMPECLGLLLREVTAFPCAKEDVHLYTPPPPSPFEGSQDVLEKTTSSGRGGPKGSTTAANARAVKQKANAKLEGGNGTKASTTGWAATAPLDEPAASPPPRHRFDTPLLLVSPPGLSGFEVTDGRERVWCVEGTVPEVHHVLTRMTAFLEAHGYSHVTSAMLFNAELFVPARAYLTFPTLVTPPADLSAASAAAVSKTSTVVAGAVSGSNSSGGGGAIALEVEPSGTGGRFHRIRLRTPLELLRQTQTHYLRHTLSDDCLDCLSCLTAVLRAATMREVELRGWLPSAQLLIALERSFGQTLEKDDLYGATLPPSPKLPTTPSAQTVGGEGPADEAEAAAASAPRSSVMEGASLGALVSFDGAIKTGAAPRRPIPPAARQRFPAVSWMMVSDTGEEVLCAFAHNAPTGLVQYHVEGQVVQAGSATLLYVSKCVCLARSFTHSHNAEYEQLLRERQRRQQTHLMQKTVLWPSNTAPGDPRAASGNDRCHQQPQRNHGKGGKTAATTVAAAASGKDGQGALLHNRDDDDDEVDGDNWLASDFYDHLDSAPSPPGSSPFLTTKSKTHRSDARHGRHGTKGQTHGCSVTATHTTITDEELWRMFDARAPAAPCGTMTISAGPAGRTEKLPPLHR
jgi:hypothetical protein